MAASVADAQRVRPVLTGDDTLYAIAVNETLHQLELSRRNGDDSTTLIVPGTEDTALESHPQIVWDRFSNALYVVWHRHDESGDAIRMTTHGADGTWSDPLTISGCASATRAGLQVALTHAEGATLMHAAWWKVAGIDQTPEYALVAFENGQHVSSDVSNLNELAGDGQVATADVEDVGDVPHPPLAMARSGEDVDIVWGAFGSTALTQLKLSPRKIVGNARLWKPGRSGGSRVPSAKLVSLSGAPVESFLSNGRIVLYTPDEQFRYVVFEKGAWSATRMIRTKENLGPDEILLHLRDLVQKQVE